MNSRLELLETKISVLENEREKQPVLFYAIIKQSEFSLNKHSTVVFETVIINEGGHYNNNDGIFVAPRDGIYMFSWTVSTVNAAYIYTELVVEENVISSTGDREVDSGSYTSASMTAFCRMNKDEHAWIRTTSWNTENYIYSRYPFSRTAFLGLLVHQNNFKRERIFKRERNFKE
ncbi:unnamed protein product [Mytilus edulis]|uniref:C1q domain-containing protein n=1 Tax=Mytilus edulis TaxID=6550 RepID=A0A8S3QWF5_MYTED|nr:unnamed protein product [Mytilus edulis]